MINKFNKPVVRIIMRTKKRKDKLPIAEIKEREQYQRTYKH